MKIPFISEIILDPKGNTYVGATANLLIFRMSEVMEEIDPTRFNVVEVNNKGKIIIKSIQSSFKGAVSYMTPERVLIYSR